MYLENDRFSNIPLKKIWVDFCPGRFYRLGKCDLFWLFSRRRYSGECILSLVWITFQGRNLSNFLGGILENQWFHKYILTSSDIKKATSEIIVLRYVRQNVLTKSTGPWHSTWHGLRTPREEIAFTARPKIQSQSQFFRYGGSIFCLPHRPNFSDIFDLCLHWVSVVRATWYSVLKWNFKNKYLTNSHL